MIRIYLIVKHTIEVTIS